MRENGFKEGISCEQRRHDSLLLRTTIALHDHEFSPRFRVLRLLTAPSEMRLGNICRYVSTLTLLELLISLMEQILLRGNLFCTSPSTSDCQSIRKLST
jgi:hypothetical protein